MARATSQQFRIINTLIGIAAGVIGSLASAAIFAFFLYRPTGSLGVMNTTARSSLSWLLLGGVVLSYLFAPQKSSRE